MLSLLWFKLPMYKAAHIRNFFSHRTYLTENDIEGTSQTKKKHLKKKQKKPQTYKTNKKSPQLFLSRFKVICKSSCSQQVWKSHQQSFLFLLIFHLQILLQELAACLYSIFTLKHLLRSDFTRGWIRIRVLTEDTKL